MKPKSKITSKKVRVSIPLSEWIAYWCAVVVFMTFITVTIGTVMLRPGTTKAQNPQATLETRIQTLEAKVQALENN